MFTFASIDVPTADVRTMSVSVFNRKHYQPRAPLLLKNAIATWPANRWSRDYLKSVVGKKTVRVFYNECGVFDFNEAAKTGPVKCQSMLFAKAADLIFSDSGRNYYIQQEDIKEQFPELLRDIARPSLLDNWKVVQKTNFWFGGKSCKTPLHFDLAHNFLVQVRGRKRVTLFPPEQSDNLYPAVGQVLPHCSRIDVFSPVDATFPRYRDAEATRCDVFLEPGDMLYLPMKWWHAVETLETSISVNFWWSGLAEVSEHAG